MRKSFPETDIRGIPRINSKVHVWKKNHGSLVTMLTRSGIGWNDTDKMIDVKDVDWNEYVKADPNARLMRHKSWPFYHDWCEIFGKDRATGEHARGFPDMVEELNDKEKQNENDVDIGIDKLLHDSYDETTSMSRSSWVVMRMRKRQLLKNVNLLMSILILLLRCKDVVNNTHELELFFSLHDEARVLLMKKLLGLFHILKKLLSHISGF
ncbi:uncharacterized protein LOC142538240 [Primulina tabacum]|uniref:uncharacterized protein LOC142538240 n=1 Tax=Primulina tabacum TaxID=48773 RepID=UPI003F5A0F61